MLALGDDGGIHRQARGGVIFRPLSDAAHGGDDECTDDKCKDRNAKKGEDYRHEGILSVSEGMESTQRMVMVTHLARAFVRRQMRHRQSVPHTARKFRS